jgi:hypothetical protein
MDKETKGPPNRTFRYFMFLEDSVGQRRAPDQEEVVDTYHIFTFGVGSDLHGALKAIIRSIHHREICR